MYIQILLNCFFALSSTLIWAQKTEDPEVLAMCSLKCNTENNEAGYLSWSEDGQSLDCTSENGHLDFESNNFKVFSEFNRLSELRETAEKKILHKYNTSEFLLEQISIVETEAYYQLSIDYYLPKPNISDGMVFGFAK